MSDTTLTPITVWVERHDDYMPHTYFALHRYCSCGQHWQSDHLSMVGETDHYAPIWSGDLSKWEQHKQDACRDITPDQWQADEKQREVNGLVEQLTKLGYRVMVAKGEDR